MIGITSRGVQRSIEPSRGFATSATALDSAMMGDDKKRSPPKSGGLDWVWVIWLSAPFLLRMLWVAYYGSGPP